MLVDVDVHSDAALHVAVDVAVGADVGAAVGADDHEHGHGHTISSEHLEQLLIFCNFCNSELCVTQRLHDTESVCRWPVIFGRGCPRSRHCRNIVANNSRQPDRQTNKQTNIGNIGKKTLVTRVNTDSE